jgi:hypothetical protein
MGGYWEIFSYSISFRGDDMKRIFAICAIVLTSLTIFSASSGAQQDKSARPSPPAKAECKLAGGKTITIDYSSPRMKGRKIFGELVPYGKVWRAGANEATTFVTSADLHIGGTAVPEGNYTIFVIPNADKWTLIISRKTGEWGTAYPGEANDQARVDMAVSKTPAPVENFTIDFDQAGGGCTLQMKWENTQASVKITAK